ncbi:MAG: hypothetical protein HC936_03480 [Leptolyngbyaceae cyanobacterium SU_3_3]|nr:hypothetical protein [Leptolyngbyaceae cyanobacterium SU_3_3]
MAKNWAVTIGINGYRNLQRLKYAVQDAESIQRFLQEDLKIQTAYYFSDNSPPIQQDYGPELDSSPTYTSLRRFFRVRFEEPFLQTGDNLWFFFAGHGIRHQDRDYLMPIDGDPGDIGDTGIPLHYISERLRRSGADNIVMVIDACRSELGRRGGIGIGEEKQQGVITLFSCSPHESSYEIEDLQQGAIYLRTSRKPTNSGRRKLCNRGKTLPSVTPKSTSTVTAVQKTTTDSLWSY